jgi:hypothetical protein
MGYYIEDDFLDMNDDEDLYCEDDRLDLDILSYDYDEDFNKINISED